MDDRQCLLVIIGATSDGKKELVALESGYRENELSWKQLLLSLKNRGLVDGPQLAIGDGAPGFWKALGQVYGDTEALGRCHSRSKICRWNHRKQDRRLMAHTQLLTIAR